VFYAWNELIRYIISAGRWLTKTKPLRRIFPQMLSVKIGRTLTYIIHGRRAQRRTGDTGERPWALTLAVAAESDTLGVGGLDSAGAAYRTFRSCG